LGLRRPGWKEDLLNEMDEEIEMKKNDVRNVLEKERIRLMQELAGYADSTGGDRAVSSYNKKIEAADQLSEFERSQALGQRLKQQLSEVEHALDKLEKGTYGLCDICGQPIAPERLKALPQTSYCLNCKSKASAPSNKIYAR
jgi:DnaK suppressor protein